MSALQNLALRVDELLLCPENMAGARRLAEACLDDPAQGHVDALQFPTNPMDPYDWTSDSILRERGLEETPVLTSAQMALALAALHDVYCSSVEKVVVVPADVPEVDDEGRVTSACRRAVRWTVIKDRVRNLGEYALPWFTLLLRRFEKSLPTSSTGKEDEQPADITGLLTWCEAKIRDLGQRVSVGGPSAANYDLVIHQIGRKADALARAFCPPDLVLSLPIVPIQAPHVYDHHKTLTVLNSVAKWCRAQLPPAPQGGIENSPIPQRTEEPIRLEETISRLCKVALYQLEIWRFFSWAKGGDAFDLRGRDAASCLADLGRSSCMLMAPQVDQALECYALVSRQPHATFFARGRSATEFILQHSMSTVRLIGNSTSINLVQPKGLQPEKLDSLRPALPVVFEAMRNSKDAFLDFNRCDQLQAEVEWEASKARAQAVVKPPTFEASPPPSLARQPPIGHVTSSTLSSERPAVQIVIELLRSRWFDGLNDVTSAEILDVLRRQGMSSEAPTAVLRLEHHGLVCPDDPETARRCKQHWMAYNRTTPDPNSPHLAVHSILYRIQPCIADCRWTLQTEMNSEPVSPQPTNIGIVIALEDEFRELFEQIQDCCQSHVDPDTSRCFYSFAHPSADSNKPYRCVATFVGDMGHTKAALVTEKLLSRWAPSTLVQLGISGGVEKDLSLGDVVVATAVDSYFERAKAVTEKRGTDFSFEFAGEVYRCSTDLINKIRHFEFSNSKSHQLWIQNCSKHLDALIPEQQRTQLISTKLLYPTVSFKVGHIASGSVVASAQTFIEWLKQRDRTYLAIEMEAAGFMAAVSEKIDAKRTLILRGISDYADERKTELDKMGRGALRRYAMRNAISLLWALLETDSLPR